MQSRYESKRLFSVLSQMYQSCVYIRCETIQRLVLGKRKQRGGNDADFLSLVHLKITSYFVYFKITLHFIHIQIASVVLRRILVQQWFAPKL